ncbi:hypothetical protein UY3_11274 [Chelonia mydas]|uniref:Myb/SANT-like DNA-binding domain-containing protein n=1 Tax=Chelonia mydas TaxID=8469 RepID=M7BHK2_CHEMY|nr:hypothetical protein UY3_11274 [Chelonia mydas]
MMERGHNRDAVQCRVKVKELWNAFRKAREANSCSSAAPTTCRFYKELDVILGGDPTSTPSTLHRPVQQGRRRSKVGARVLRRRKTPRNP